MYYRYFLLLAALVASSHSHKLVKRMINGEPANISDYPYQVFLGIDTVNCPNCGKSRCGGAILSKHYVLTAAHCTFFPKEKLLIRAGSSYQNEGGSVHYIEYVVVHENFSVDAMENRASFDIAVIRVQKPFAYSATIQSIDLPLMDHRQIPANTPAKSAGWGVVKASFEGNDELIELNDRLQKLDFHIVDTKACNDSYVSWGGLFEGQFCAATDDPVHKFAFRGDSGSPLVVGRELVGITSWGGEPQLPSTPAVYTDVGYLLDWIDQWVVYDGEIDPYASKIDATV